MGKWRPVVQLRRIIPSMFPSQPVPEHNTPEHQSCVRTAGIQAFFLTALNLGESAPFRNPGSGAVLLDRERN